MAAVELKIDFDDTVRALSSTKKEVTKALRSGVSKLLGEVKRTAKGSLPFTSRSGRLAKSMRVQRRTARKQGVLTASIRPTAFYSLMVEGGTTKVAKKGYELIKGGPFLHIPLPNNMTNGGWPPKISATSAFKNHGAFIWRVKGKVFIALPTRPPTPIFILKKEVKTKPRPFMKPAFLSIVPKASRIVNEEVQKVLKRLFRKRRAA